MWNWESDERTSPTMSMKIPSSILYFEWIFPFIRDHVTSCFSHMENIFQMLTLVII